MKGEKDGEWSVILDKTIFHPQGGGQPADEGEIRSDNAVFKITGLKAKDDCILHSGVFSKVFNHNNKSYRMAKALRKVKRSLLKLMVIKEKHTHDIIQLGIYWISL